MANPPKPSELREPTDSELLTFMHADERQFWQSGDGSPQQRAEFWEGIKAQWRAKQEPAMPASNPEPPESKSDDDTPSRVVEALQKTAEEILSISTSSDRLEDKSESLSPQPPLIDAGEQPKTPSKEQKHWLDAVLESPLLAGVLSVIALGIGFSPKASTSATWICFVVAWLLFARMIYMLEHIRVKPTRQRLRITAVASFIAFIVLFAAGWWLMLPVKSVISKPEATSATPMPSPSVSPPTLVAIDTSPSPSPQSTPIVAPSIVSRAGEPTPSSPPPADLPLSVLKGIPVKGGSPQRLDALMTAAGYTGTTTMVVLYVRSNDENESEIIVGTRPDLNAKNSWVIESASEWFEFRGGENTARVYILSPKDGKVDITYRPK
jgi:hypothetical protein